MLFVQECRVSRVQVQLQSIFNEIKASPPRQIALVVKRFNSREVWDEGKKVTQLDLEGGADKFSAQIGPSIRHLNFHRNEVQEKAEEIRQCDMCVVTGDSFYSLVSIGKAVLDTGYKGRLFLEITAEEADRSDYARMAAQNAERLSATDLLNKFVYLTKKRGSKHSIDFPLVGLAIPETTIASKIFTEGIVRQVVLSRPERDQNARRECIRLQGAKCAICHFDFSERFGIAGEGLIHVHHLNPISSAKGEKREVDPSKDLIPVCPNCHLFIHSRKKMYTPDEVRELLSSAG